MPEGFRVNFTMKSAGDLEEIFDYIEKDSPAHASKLIQRLLDAIDSLAILPHRNKRVTGDAALGEQVHSMVVRPYLIRHCIDNTNQVVTVLSVRHGARRPEA